MLKQWRVTVYQKKQPAKPGIVYGIHRPETTANQIDRAENAPEAQQLIILDPQRPGDRRCLARILAQIAWRLTKEQAAQNVVSSHETRQNPQ
jgi:hypothetical protein